MPSLSLVLSTRPCYDRVMHALWLLCMGLFLAGLPELSHGQAQPLTSFSAAVRRYTPLQGRMTVILSAGHVSRRLPVVLQWPDVTSLMQAMMAANTTESLRLAPKDPLVATELPSGWFDGLTPWTREKLRVQARGGARNLHAAPASASDPLVAALTADGKHRGVLDASAASPLWLAHRALVFTGTGLHFVPQRASAEDVATLLAGGPRSKPGTRAKLWAIPTLGRLVNASVLWTTPGRRAVLRANTTGQDDGTLLAVRVVWAPEQDLTVLPQDLYTALLQGQSRFGVADEATLLVDVQPLHDAGQGTNRPSPLGDARLVMRHLDLVNDVTWQPMPTATSKRDAVVPTLVLGRRWMRAGVRGWAYDASTATYTVALASIPSNEGPPYALRIIVCIMGLILCWLYSYWVSELVLHLVPPLPGAPGPLMLAANPSTPWNRLRPVIHTVLALLLAVPTHVIAVYYAGQGPLLDTSLADAYQEFAVVLASTTAPLWVALVVVMVALVAVKRYRPWRQPSSAAVWWRHCLVASLHAMVVVRSLTACVVALAGASLLGATVLAILLAMGTVYQASLIILVQSSVTVAAPQGAWRHGLYYVWFFAGAAQLACGVVLMVYGQLDVVQPLLQIANATYSPSAVVAAGMLLFALVLLFAAFTLVRELRARVMTSIRAYKKQL